MKEAARVSLIAVGWLFVILGVIGAFLPILPTTPLLLVALTCFSKSSPRFQRMLLEHPRCGPILRQWQETRTVSRANTYKALVLIAVAFSLSLFLLREHLVFQIVLGLCGVGLMGFVWSLRDRATGGMRILSVQSEDEIQRLAEMAREIWMDHYEPLIGREQVDYMLATFQSATAIRDQLDRGVEYVVAISGNEWQGYLGVQPHEPAGKLFLSKLYVKRKARGTGTGRKLLDVAVARAEEGEAEAVWLTVNRHNTETIAWYQRQGFVVAGEVKKDIGNGFVMDDFVCERRL